MLKFNKEQIQKLQNEALREYPKECCGLLIGNRKKGEIWDIRPVFNIEQVRPEKKFELDPRAHLKIQKEVRKKGLEILGCYHSHPNGTVIPSQYDLNFSYSDWFYLIVATDDKNHFEYGLYKLEGGVFERVKISVPGTKGTP